MCIFLSPEIAILEQAPRAPVGNRTSLIEIPLSGRVHEIALRVHGIGSEISLQGAFEQLFLELPRGVTWPKKIKFFIFLKIATSRGRKVNIFLKIVIKIVKNACDFVRFRARTFCTNFRKIQDFSKKVHIFCQKKSDHFLYENINNVAKVGEKFGTFFGRPIFVKNYDFYRRRWYPRIFRENRDFLTNRLAPTEIYRCNKLRPGGHPRWPLLSIFTNFVDFYKICHFSKTRKNTHFFWVPILATLRINYFHKILPDFGGRKISRAEFFPGSRKSGFLPPGRIRRKSKFSIFGQNVNIR